MTLLGAEFQMGTSDETPASGTATAGVDMSLDEMIASRRKQPKFAVQKTVSNVDQSIAKSRAQRNAKLNYRRGLATSSKPSAMQIEKEVQKQVAQSASASLKKDAAAKKKTPSKTTGFARAEERNRQRENRKIVAKARQQTAAVAAVSTGRAPSKKAVMAAVNAMESAGFKIPENTQMVISFVPTPAAVAPSAAAAPLNNSNTTAKPTQNNGGGGNYANNNNGNTGGPNQNTNNGGGTRRRNRR